METAAPPPESGTRSSAARQLGLWLLAALAATAVLGLVLRWEHQRAPWRFVTFGSGDARRGEQLFRAKGCAHCHAVNGVGGRVGPDLTGTKLSGTDRLVATMWNHAPKMWEQAQAHDVEYPNLTHEEVAHVSAYLSAPAPSPTPWTRP